MKIKWSGLQEHGVADKQEQDWQSSGSSVQPLGVPFALIFCNAVSGSAGLAPNATDGIVVITE